MEPAGSCFDNDLFKPLAPVKQVKEVDMISDNYNKKRYFLKVLTIRTGGFATQPRRVVLEEGGAGRFSGNGGGHPERRFVRARSFCCS